VEKSNKKAGTLPSLAKKSFLALMSMAVTLLIVVCAIYFYAFIQLPDVSVLNNIQLQVPLKVYTSDGQLIGEYGAMRRSPVTIDQVPKQLINAVLATEDQRYYEHSGVDVYGLFRATRELLITGRKSQGASTITMQVARNFFLTNKKTYGRKINEILLALKIDQEFSKETILQLYLNRVYLGERAYGVDAAAQVYYGKTLNQLTLPEMAMIAGLPQAPSRENPIVDSAAALDRRNHVLQRMYELGYINQSTYQQAIATPNTASYHGQRVVVEAPYVGEMVRAAMYQQYGDAAYTSGFKVYTTLKGPLQLAANQALRSGLMAYDHRHGYRGAEKYIGQISNKNTQDLMTVLQDIPVYNHLLPAVVLGESANNLVVLLGNGQKVIVTPAGYAWTGASISKLAQPGDVVRIQNMQGSWQLEQIPKAEAAIVAMNPNNGEVLALDGGFSFQQSHFNRITQASRQPGSGFKPFFYSAALDKGFTLATLINDAPVVQEDAQDNILWRPVNDTEKFYGPTRLRVGLIQSRNLVAIRLLQDIGISYALNYVSRFGFDPAKLPHTLSLALGSGGVTPLQIVNGYAVFANGGYRVTPYLIDHVEDAKGQIIYQAHLPVVCPTCSSTPMVTAGDNTHSQIPPAPQAPRVISVDNAYLITSALQDVIRKGTGVGALVMKRTDIAGKTGTTNDFVDAWFSGYNSDIVATAWVGFDNPESLHEHGAQAALPIWVDFMEQALHGMPEHAMAQPSGITAVRIDPATGQLAAPGQKNAIFEIFTQQTAPTEQAQDSPAQTVQNPDAGSNEEQQLF
jgi:penicillin-binding protein 1A